MFHFRIAALATCLVVLLPHALASQGLNSPNGRFRAEIVGGTDGTHYRVFDEQKKAYVLTTTAQHRTQNEVKAGLFSNDSTKFAAAYHYSHEGRYTYIGVWSTEGRFLYSRRKSGWTTDFAGVFDPEVETMSVDITPAVTARVASLDATPFKKGVAFTSWRPGEYSSQHSDETLSTVIAPLGVDWISLLVTCYQATVTSTEINCTPETSAPTDDDLRHVIRFAHSLRIQVMLKPHLDLSNDPRHWRGDIDLGNNESAWTKWFEAYRRFILHYAIIAQTTGVDLLAVGTELEGTSHRSDQWRAVIKDVRRAYDGPITYAANWSEASRLTWWDSVDLIGVDAYYPLTATDQPTLTELRAAWNPIVKALGDLSMQWQRRVLFTEIGYRSVNGANQAPYDYKRRDSIDLQEQADCYRVALEVFRGHEWFDGYFWWNWTPNPVQGGQLDSDYTASSKPAATVLKRFYRSRSDRNAPR